MRCWAWRMRSCSLLLLSWMKRVFCVKILWSFSLPLMRPVVWLKLRCASASCCSSLAYLDFSVCKSVSNWATRVWSCSTWRRSRCNWDSSVLYEVLKAAIWNFVHSTDVWRYSSLSCKYFLVRWACFSNDCKFFSTSANKSSTRVKSSSVARNLDNVSFLRALYLEMPAACSNKARRAFSLSCNKSSTILSEMMA